MFNKKLSEIQESDIQALIENEQKESLVLEFKSDISGTEREKKELPKDVSAIANSEGGFIIFGIKDVDGKAVEIVGVSKLIGNQPTEEWIESVLISNVRPHLTVKLKTIPVSFKNDRVIIILQVFQSSKRPHMVTIDGKNAYYKRHNYQSQYADEHEVRSMFFESKASLDEMRDFIKSRKLDGMDVDDFAHTPLSKRIRDDFLKIRKDMVNTGIAPFVLFASCPRFLNEKIDIASEDFQGWLKKQEQIKLFEWDIDFLGYEKYITSDSLRALVCTGGDTQNLIRYVEVFRNGYVENGFGSELIWNRNGVGVLFQIAYFTGAFWLYMKFLKELYSKIGYYDEVAIIIALSGIKGMMIHGFGRKNKEEVWRQPYETFGFDRPPISEQSRVFFQKNVIISEMGDSEIEELVKVVSSRVSNAFGERITKCFDDEGLFDRLQLAGFHNIR